jgi:nondiscriminating glutamyl-tRNA synthetase
MGVLPQALANYLALLGWAPSGGTREIFSSEELVKEFSLERVTPSPAVFDLEKLYWLNRKYLVEQLKSEPERLIDLGAAHLIKAGFLRSSDEPLDPAQRKFIGDILALLVPAVDRLDQLPERASLIFRYDAKAALAAPDNAATLAWPQTDAVLARFIFKILEDESANEGKLAPEQFKAIVNQVKAETSAKGKELFHPIRIVLTGSHSGPEFDKLIPILEQGSHLHLPEHVLSVRERVEQFAKARTELELS